MKRHAFCFLEKQSQCAAYFLIAHSFYVNTFNYNANAKTETSFRQNYRSQIQQGGGENG